MAKILVVEDDLPTVELLDFTLKEEGYEVIVAYDAAEALRKLEKERPHLILLDIMLPTMDGFQVCQLIKHNVNFAHIPIIMVTAKIRREDRDLGFEKGADDYITKPFEPSFLVEKLKGYLSKPR